MVWDILNNLQGDYTMLFRQRIRWPTIAYLVSRYERVNPRVENTFNVSLQVSDLGIRLGNHYIHQ